VVRSPRDVPAELERHVKFCLILVRRPVSSAYTLSTSSATFSRHCVCILCDAVQHDVRIRWQPAAGLCSHTPYPARDDECDAGVPRHLVFREVETAERLQAVLASVPLASVKLHASVEELPSASLSAVVSAMAGSAATLTALYELPLVELRDMPSLAPFTELRALDLRQRTEAREALLAAQLPVGIEELTLTSHATLDDLIEDAWLNPPALVGFHRLPNLRRITLNHYYSYFWHLFFTDNEDGKRSLSRLPPCLEVCSVSP